MDLGFHSQSSQVLQWSGDHCVCFLSCEVVSSESKQNGRSVGENDDTKWWYYHRINHYWWYYHWNTDWIWWLMLIVIYCGDYIFFINDCLMWYGYVNHILWLLWWFIVVMFANEKQLWPMVLTVMAQSLVVMVVANDHHHHKHHTSIIPC